MTGAEIVELLGDTLPVRFAVILSNGRLTTATMPTRHESETYGRLLSTPQVRMVGTVAVIPDMDTVVPA